MVKNCTMSEVSRVRIGVEEDEIELTLGLSIGGSFRKTEKSKLIDQNPTNLYAKIDSESTNIGTDFGSECVDPQRKREVQAQRRLEARKKREMATNGEFIDDKMWLEAQRLQNRVRDREMRENEDNDTEAAFRKCKNEIQSDDCVSGEEMRYLNLTLGNKVAVDQNNQNSNTIGSSSSPPVFPLAPARDSCPPAGYFGPALKFVPFTIGFGYHPNVMPGWDPSLGNFGGELNVIRPMVCRSFQPYQVNQKFDHGVFKNCDSECNGSRDGGNGNAVSNGSNGSPVHCSSAGSDHRSKFQQGGSNSDSGSHSQPEHHQQNASAASDPQEQSEHISYSSHIEPTQVIKKTTYFPEKMVSPSSTQPGGINSENPISSPLKRDNGDLEKPPKPQTGNQDSLCVSQMPCVSTTGNGPNGKTITGFLYRYTKTEVSIKCVCHGSSFSPAEFVKHAGGKDISHPLRHITVIPSAFG